MNDSTPNLPGFEEWPEIKHSMMPDFNQVITQRLNPISTKISNGFDPHAMMVKKNQIDKGEVTVDEPPSVKWPEKDIKALEDFCNQHGIMGFNSGRMPPLVALAMLKDKMGFAGVPLEERVPTGYQKRGTPISHGPNYPYDYLQNKRTIISG